MKYGEKVRVILNSGEELEGFLIPSPSSDITIIKLKSGYNVGIKNDEIKDIKYLGEKVEVAKFPRRKPEKKEGLKNVSIVVTGGTIMSRVDYRTGGVHMFLDPDELLYNVPELENIAVIRNISNPFSIASEDMTPCEWIRIAEEVYKELSSGADGVIIPHGTDTMHYTSAALSFMLRNLSKPVCLTGAQRSSDRGSSDAYMNLICSCIYATSDIAEVSVVMHGYISDEFCYAHRGTRVRKMHTERRDAFQSVNDKPLAKIYPNGKLEVINNNYRKRSDEDIILDTKICDKVALIKVFPGSSPEIIDFYVDKGYKGLVLEGTGFGHVPTQTLDKKYSWLDHIKRAIENDVIICMTSQTIFGRTNPYVYSNARLLHDLGVIYCEDMLPEVAYVKLKWVLGHTENPEEVKKLMLTPLAGEIKPRSLEDEFINNKF
jgi:glutamyl-tRNA(Gln) amidotransferase subunit D